MSYILDALRRADSERERASIPGIHTQPVPQVSTQARGMTGTRPWAWLVAGVLVVLLGQGLWQWVRSPATGDDVPEAAAGAASAGTTSPAEADPLSPPPPAPQPPAAVMATEALQEPGPPPAVVVQIPPPERPSPRTAAARAGTPATAPSAATSRRPPPRLSSASPGAAPPTPPAAAAPPQEAQIHALAELPPHVRQALPPLQVGGSVYSDDPGSRFVILNGLVFHENDKPATEVLLERIELKSAVLSFRGYRFRISF
jgi:general secretion pathway protein B